jgi:sensor domain CHASE-containing protein
MSTIEIIIAVLVLVAVIGQFAFVTWARSRTLFKNRENAKKRAELIEREFDRNNGGKK